MSKLTDRKKISHTYFSLFSPTLFLWTFCIVLFLIVNKFLLFQNANVLSAVLCLIKELDYSSLEVVEMAVRCRMEELDD